MTPKTRKRPELRVRGVSYVLGDDNAEREGFEPSDPVTQVNSLAVSPIRPLSHLSLPLRPIFGLYFRDGNAGQDVETSQGYRNGPATIPR